MTVCAFTGCEKKAVSKGWCQGHYAQWHSGREMRPLRVRAANGTASRECGFKGCAKPAHARGLCSGHYAQERQGKPLKPLQRQNGYNHWTEDGYKKCPGCGQYKHRSQYNQNRKECSGLMSECSECAKARTIAARYRITREQYRAILAYQGGGCAICGAEKSRGGKALHVDHDHACCPGPYTCGKCIRGILCAACNRNVDKADTPERVAYLTEYASWEGSLIDWLGV